MKHLGDFDLSTVIYGKFTTFRPSTGAAYTLAGTPALSVYKDNSVTQSTTGVTLTADFDSVTGLNHFAIDTSADGTFYSSGSFFDIVITTGTVDSVSVVGSVVASFTLRKNSALKPTTAGRTLVVDASGLADANMVKMGPTGSGTAQTARDIGASVLLSSGTGTGQLDFTSGVVKANVTQLLGTAWLTPGTAGTPDVNVKLWNGLTTVALPLVPTVAGRTLDVSATGEAGVDWANVGSPSTSVNLSATTVNLVNTATTVTNQLTTAQIATAVWTDTTAGDFTTALSIGKSIMNGVSLGTGLTINAYTGNTPQTGDSYARIGATGSGLTSLAPASTALSTATWTSARAGYLDNINNANLASVPAFPSNFASLAITAGGIVQADLQTIKTQTVTCSGGVTIPAATLASTTNITAGTITTATNVTTVNGLAAGVITAAAVATGAIDADALATDAVTEIWAGSTFPSAATVAAAVWDLDATAHQTQGTFGQAIGDPGADTDSIWALANSYLDAAVSSRMATYTQPTGFLSATFPSGTIANTTNITAGTITTTTNLTNLPAITTDWLTATGLASSAVTEIVNGVWDAAQSGHTTAGTFGKYLDAQVSTVGGGTAADIADAVWDEAISGHLTAGTTGAKLNSAAAAGDPLSNDVPGTYAGGTAGYALGQIGSGTVTFSGPVISDTNTFEVIQGDDYLIADGRSFNFTFGATPNLTSSTVVMRIQTPVILEITGTQSGQGTSAQLVKFEMTKIQTAALQVKNYAFDIQATLSDASVVTLARSTFLVLSQVA